MLCFQHHHRDQFHGIFGNIFCSKYVDPDNFIELIQKTKRIIFIKFCFRLKRCKSIFENWTIFRCVYPMFRISSSWNIFGITWKSLASIFWNFHRFKFRKNFRENSFTISHGIVAMAVESEGSNLLLIGCDLGGVKPDWSSDPIQHRFAPTLLRFSFLSPRIKLKRESVKIKNQQNF